VANLHQRVGESMPYATNGRFDVPPSTIWVGRTPRLDSPFLAKRLGFDLSTEG